MLFISFFLLYPTCMKYSRTLPSWNCGGSCGILYSVMGCFGGWHADGRMWWGAGGYWSCVGVSSWRASVHEAGGLRGTNGFGVSLGSLVLCAWVSCGDPGTGLVLVGPSCHVLLLAFFSFARGEGSQLGLFHCAVWGLSGVSMFSCVEHKSYLWNDFLLFFHMVLA